MLCCDYTDDDGDDHHYDDGDDHDDDDDDHYDDDYQRYSIICEASSLTFSASSRRRGYRMDCR